MKKITILLSFLLVLSFSLQAQFVKNWETQASASSHWLNTLSNSNNSVAYNGVTGNLLASVRGQKIYVLNASTGLLVDSLAEGTITEGFRYSKVRVDPTGVIYSCNLATGAGLWYVFRWANQADANPTKLVFTVSARTGDAFEVVGSGINTKIYASGSSSAKVYVFTTADGSNFTMSDSITVTAGLARGGIATEAGKDFLWVNGAGTALTKVGLNGTVISTPLSTAYGFGYPNDSVHTAYHTSTYFEHNGSKYVAITGRNSASYGKVMALYNVTVSEVNPRLYGFDTLGAAYVTNANATGDISVKKNSDGSVTLFHVITNNGIASWTTKPMLSGNYYIGASGTGPNGSTPHYATFRNALDDINNATISGDCTFFITSDITETYSDTRGIGLGINPEPYTITFKPYTGVQPTITFNYPTDLNGGPSGAFIIGIPGKGNVQWDSMRTTKNIIIDGSNTENGTTRDLTLQTSTTAQRNAFPVTIVGAVSNLVIKNTNIYYKAAGLASTSGNLFLGAIHVRSRNYLATNWVPKDILIENNHISGNFEGVALNAQGYITYQSGTPLPSDYPNNITLKNNLIEGKRRAIALYRAGSHDIIGNTIVLNQDVAANYSNEAIHAVDVDTNSIVNIYNNKIEKVSSMTNLVAVGNTAISIESFGTYNVYNNFIYGFALTATNPVAYVRGIRNSSANATLNCYFNSIYMTDILAGGTVAYNGILISNGTNDLKNNIVYSAVTDFASYCINREGTLGTLISDNNDFYAEDATNGNVGLWNAVPAQTLAAWQTASAQDANSISANPGFTSGTDLHLASNVSPVVGKGIAIAGITKDIDNDDRDVIPEIGADEFPGYIPVEIASFTSSLNGNVVTLTWTTASETNNAGFEVEKASVVNGENGTFEKVGYVKGFGTTANVQTYSYIEKAENGSFVYRLKQIDFDGKYNYSNEVKVEIGLPTEFTMSQNYPNPFNPNTSIQFTVPELSHVRLDVYSITGELVNTIVNEVKEIGSHNVVFNASKLSSGVYIYRMTAGNLVITKKMNLLK